MLKQSVCAEVSYEKHSISHQRLKRSALIQFIATTPPTTIAMEACYSSDYWARVCESHGHKAQLIPAQHVKPFTRGNKTDANDSVAIIEASQRPNLKFELPLICW